MRFPLKFNNVYQRYILCKLYYKTNNLQILPSEDSLLMP